MQSGITDVLTRVKNEFEIEERSASGTEMDALEKLWALKGKGILTETEFESKKQQILANTSHFLLLPRSALRPMTANAKIVPHRFSLGRSFAHGAGIRCPQDDMPVVGRQ